MALLGWLQNVGLISLLCWIRILIVLVLVLTEALWPRLVRDCMLKGGLPVLGFFGCCILFNLSDMRDRLVMLILILVMSVISPLHRMFISSFLRMLIDIFLIRFVEVALCNWIVSFQPILVFIAGLSAGVGEGQLPIRLNSMCYWAFNEVALVLSSDWQSSLSPCCLIASWMHGNFIILGPSAGAGPVSVVIGLDWLIQAKTFIPFVVNNGHSMVFNVHSISRVNCAAH